MVEDLRELADELGRTPKASEYDEHGSYSRHPINRHFGSWNRALRAAGLELHKEHRLPDERLIQDLRLVALDLGWAPSVREYAEHGKHAPWTIFEHFDGWIDALEIAGLDLMGARERDWSAFAESPPSHPLDALSPEELGLSPIGERRVSAGGDEPP